MAEALAPAVHSRTEGLPMFVNWLCDALMEQGLLHRGHGVWRLAQAPETVISALPASLQRLFELQLDALSPRCRTLLELGCVIGREFDLTAVAALAGEAPERMEASCRAALRSGLLHRRLDENGRWRYGFCHDLVREALHGGLEQSRRAELHRACAALLAQRDDVDPAVLARHWQAAGQLEAAGSCHLDAARRAAARHAHVEAAGHFAEAAGALDGRAGHEEEAVDALLGWGSSLVTSVGYAHPRVQEVYARACERAAVFPDAVRHFAALHGLRSYHLMAGQLAEAARLEPGLQETMAASRDPLVQARGHAQIGERLHFAGRQHAAREALRTACHLSELSSRDPLARLTWSEVAVGAEGNLAMVECELGHSDRGRDRIRRLLARVERPGHPYSTALARYYAAVVHLLRRDHAASRCHVEVLLRQAADHGFVDLDIWGGILLGHLDAEAGRLDAGIERLRCGLDSLHRSGTVLSRSGALQVLASALARRGAAAEAQECLDTAFALVARTGEGCRYASLHATRAEALAAAGADGTAVVAALTACHREAVRYESRSWALRAATALVNLCGGEPAWRQRLAAALAAHPEGADTPDVQEARAALAGVTAR